VHLDIEWKTSLRDDPADTKIEAICTAVNKTLPRKVEILRGNHSRPIPGGKFKNSFHLYPLITFEHNAEGSMKEFVK